MRAKKQAPALSFGHAIHKGLETMFKQKQLLPAIKSFLEDFPEDLSDKHTQDKGKTLLTTYYEVRKADFDKALKVEIGLAYDIGENVVMVGRMDLILRGEGDEIIMRDFKTASRIGPSYVARYVRDVQMACYALACTIHFGRCDEVQLDVIPVMKKTEIPELFQYDYKPFLDQFRQLALDEARIIRQQANDNYWPQNWLGCQEFSGCPYIDLCYYPENVERTKEAFYDVEPWEPWKGIIDIGGQQ